MKTHPAFRTLFIAGSLSVAALTASAKNAGARDEFKAMDADGDGKVTRTEHLEFSRSLFKLSDANHDKRVSSTEWIAAAEAASKQGNNPVEKMDPAATAAQLRMMDKNGDSVVSDQESDQFAASIFTRSDKNGDGVLTEKEYKAASKELKKATERKEVKG